MGIGKRRTRIDIVSIDGTSDGIGGSTTNRTVVKSTWAQVKELTGVRAAEFNALYNKQPITLTIRTSSYPVTTNNLIVYQGKDCTIQSVVTDQLKKITTIMVWE